MPILEISLVLLAFAGALLVPFGLAGQFLLPIGALLAWFFAAEPPYSGFEIGVFFAVAAIAEGIEALLGFALGRKAGGSIQSGFGAIGGGLLGGIVCTAAIPIPILGTMIGAIGGTFAGAATVEYVRERDASKATKVGTASAIGRALGIAVKGASACGLAVYVLMRLFF